ncbi:MAG: IS1595 family transposase, partial [Salinisphaera sp.]
QYRFNRRYDLRSILLRLIRATATTAPWAENRIRLAEFRA